MFNKTFLLLLEPRLGDLLLYNFTMAVHSTRYFPAGPSGTQLRQKLVSDFFGQMSSSSSSSSFMPLLSYNDSESPADVGGDTAASHMLRNIFYIITGGQLPHNSQFLTIFLDTF